MYLCMCIYTIIYTHMCVYIYTYYVIYIYIYIYICIYSPQSCDLLVAAQYGMREERRSLQPGGMRADYGVAGCEHGDALAHRRLRGIGPSAVAGDRTPCGGEVLHVCLKMPRMCRGPVFVHVPRETPDVTPWSCHTSPPQGVGPQVPAPSPTTYK